MEEGKIGYSLKNEHVQNQYEFKIRLVDKILKEDTNEIIENFNFKRKDVHHHQNTWRN